MPVPPRHRDDLTRGIPLPSTWVNALMRLVGSQATNVAVGALTSTAVYVYPADVGPDVGGWVMLSIGGKWRWVQNSVNAAHPGGAAGRYNVWAATAENDLTGVDPADSTDYGFSLVIRTVASGPPAASGATAYSRLIALCDWDGAAITALYPLIGETRVKRLRITHTFGVAGAVHVPSGQTDVILPMRVALPSASLVLPFGTTYATLVNVSHRLGNGAGGTSVTYKVQRNGADLTGFGPLTTGSDSNWASVTPTEVALANGDSLAPVVTAISGSPLNLSITLGLAYIVL